MDLSIYLNDIEKRLNERDEESLLSQWRSFADGKNEGGIFTPIDRTPCPTQVDWPEIYLNDALDDEDLMILSQFHNVSKTLESGSYQLPTIRSNYGVGIVPTSFGAEVFKMPKETQILPNVRSLPESLPAGKDAIRQLIEADLPDIKKGFGAHVFSVGEKYMEIKSKYPKINKYVAIDHPDCQGPFDICELLYGSDIFLDLYDDPELVHALLRKVTDFYKLYLDKWFSMVPHTTPYHTVFGRIHRGAICVRDDSAMNLSPDFYEEFIHPYDKEVLGHFGGGSVHFCGRGDHYIEKMSSIEGLYAVDMSQPHYNNMSFIFQNTIDKGINLFAREGEYLDSIEAESHCLSRLFVQ